MESHTSAGNMGASTEREGWTRQRKKIRNQGLRVAEQRERQKFKKGKIYCREKYKETMNGHTPGDENERE